MGVGIEAGACGNPVVIVDQEEPVKDVGAAAVVAEGERVLGVQPSKSVAKRLSARRMSTEGVKSAVVMVEILPHFAQMGWRRDP